MDLFQIVNFIIVVVGVPTIAGWLIYLGRKLNTIESIEEDKKHNIRPDLKDNKCLQKNKKE